MSWNKHIEKTASKANSKLGFLRRNVKTRDQSLKEKAYKSIVRPTLEYCSTVWDPYYQQEYTTVEKVQRRAARWVTGRYHNKSSVSDMIHYLGWRGLEQRRVDSRLCMLYKIRYDLVDIPLGPVHEPTERWCSFPNNLCQCQLLRIFIFPSNHL